MTAALLLLSAAAITHRPPHATDPAAGSVPVPLQKPSTIDCELVTQNKTSTPPAHSKIHVDSNKVSLGPALYAIPH